MFRSTASPPQRREGLGCSLSRSRCTRAELRRRCTSSWTTSTRAVQPCGHQLTLFPDTAFFFVVVLCFELCSGQLGIQGYDCAGEPRRAGVLCTFKVAPPPPCRQVNKEILRLARCFGFAQLHEHAVGVSYVNLFFLRSGSVCARGEVACKRLDYRECCGPTRNAQTSKQVKISISISCLLSPYLEGARSLD